MKIKREFVYVAMAVILAIPNLYYFYLRIFNSVIAGLTPESLTMRMAEGQRSGNYIVYQLRYVFMMLFVVYIVVLVMVFVNRKYRSNQSR